MQSSTPSVAIIIPCFNRWPHVQEAIDSVLAQTWLNIRCIVVDDASTDDSLAMLRQHYKEEPRVQIEAQTENRGQAAARNLGVGVTDTEYIGFLDSDDLLIDTAVENRMQVAIANPEFLGMIFGDNIDEKSGISLLPGKKENEGRLSLGEYLDNMSWLNSNTFLIKREGFLYLNGFNENLRKKEDREFFIRALSYQDALYAPGACCIVRSISTQRARHDHIRIIEQGERFINAIQDNEHLTEHLSQAQIRRLVEDDTRSVLQSLYKLKRGKEFRKKVRYSLTSGKVKVTFRLLKRYLLSFAHSSIRR